jgi:hypothetical protein
VFERVLFMNVDVKIYQMVYVVVWVQMELLKMNIL